MTEPSLDLQAYLDRIEWGGSTARTYEALAGLLHAQVTRIPFENLDVLLDRPPRLDSASLERKMVHDRRGGYCFEHASLMAAVLDALGFAPVRHTARVVMILPRHLAPRGHMFLTVTLPEGTFVIDPGFGGLAPRVPVPLAEGVEAVHGDTAHWMTRDDGMWMLRARVADKASDCWVASFEPDNLVDFEMGSHYMATHPESPFRNRIMLRAFTDEGRVTVMNRDVTQWQGSQSRTRTLRDRRELRSLLNAHFGFDLPEIEGLRVPAIPDWT